MIEHVSFERFRDNDACRCSLGSILVIRQVNVEGERNGVFIDGLNMSIGGKIRRTWIEVLFKSASKDSLGKFAGILTAGASDLPSSSEINWTMFGGQG